MKLKQFAIIIGVLALVGAALYSAGVFDGDDLVKPVSREERKKMLKNKRLRDKKSSREAVRDAMKKSGVKTGQKKLHIPADLFANLQGKDKKLANAVQDALDNNDFELVLKEAEKSLASTNAEVRINAIEALGWFGVDALPELTGAMSDPDEEVADAAENAWEIAIDGMEEPEQKFAVVAAAFSTLTKEDYLVTIGGQLSNVALDLIDGPDDPEVGAANRLEIIQTLVDVMDNGTSANVEAAKEVYNDITGNDWVSVEEAELYLRNPDGYESPEDRGSDYDYDYIDPAVKKVMGDQNAEPVADPAEGEDDLKTEG